MHVRLLHFAQGVKRLTLKWLGKISMYLLSPRASSNKKKKKERAIAKRPIDKVIQNIKNYSNDPKEGKKGNMKQKTEVTNRKQSTKW